MGKKILLRAMVLLTITVSVFFWGMYGKDRGVFYGDSMGYYIYLPSCFIYHDFKHINNLPEGRGIPEGIKSNMQLRENESVHSSKGYAINQYTYGVAFMELPFFLVAHIYETTKGFQANGYSDTYNLLIKYSSIVYALLGLLFVYKVLRRYYNEAISLITVCVLFLGTNLFWFTLAQSGMAHIPLFFLYALLIYLTIRLHDRPRYDLFLLSGLVAGMIIVIRPSDIICLLIPILYNIYSIETLKAKMILIRHNIRGILLFGFALFIPVIPQLLYWHELTGHFVFYSYGGQSFEWLHPHIIEGLFSFRNGWLPYSLVMIFSLTGMFLYKSIKSWAWCIWIVFPLYVYVIYSWYCYNYINGLGSRPMIHLYPLLAISLAAFIQYVSVHGRITKWILGIVCIFFISVNICYSMQSDKRILCSEDSNMMYNLEMLYRMKPDYNDFVCMDNGILQPHSGDMVKQRTLGCQYYSDSLSPHYEKDTTINSRYVYHMLAGEEYQPRPILYKYHSSEFKNARWLKCSGMFKVKDYTGLYDKHLLVLSVRRNGDNILWMPCKIDNKIGLLDPADTNKEITIDRQEVDRWGRVSFFVKLPSDIQEGDEIMLDIWSVGKKQMFIDYICLELYAHK